MVEEQASLKDAGTDLAAKDLPPAEKCVGAPSFNILVHLIG
jgi:hypothetical protein